MKTTIRSAFTLIEIMVVVAIIGILAAIVVPGFGRAIAKSRQQACSINRKNIDGAKLQWAMENKQPPTALPTDGDLFGDDKPIEHKPDCPAGGAYSLNTVAEKCTCDALKHVN